MSEGTIKRNLQYTIRNTKIFLWRILVFLLIIYAFSGVYSISPHEVGVLQRFGKVVNSHIMPGIHYSFPWPLDRINKVPVHKVHRIIFDDFSENSDVANVFKDLTNLDSYCITGDNNVVNLICVLQYTIDHPSRYLFQVKLNERVLKNILSSTIIHTLASMPVDEILTYGKRTIERSIELELQQRLDNIEAGLSVTFVELRAVYPPKVVQESFDEVINAQIDNKKYITAAESYRHEQILKAKAKANRMIQEAEAYRSKIIAEAQGETKRFLERLRAGNPNKSVVKHQLYMEFVKEVWPNIEEKYVVKSGTADYLRLKLEPH